LLITIRLSANSLAGTARTLVAVGTVSDCCMFFTIAAAAPRIGLIFSPSDAILDRLSTGAALAAAAGAGLPVLGSPVLGPILGGVGGGAVAGRAVTCGASRWGTVATWPFAAGIGLATSFAALPVGWPTLSPTPVARWLGL
jgi:hypothetical protein